MKLWAALSLAALLLAGAAGSAGARAPAQALVVEQGQVFKVTLAANHTTGYRWVLAKLPSARVLKLVSNEYLPDKAETRNGARRKGVGGHEVWTFQAMGKGLTSITLQYVRPWEKEKPPLKVRHLEVQVR